MTELQELAKEAARIARKAAYDLALNAENSADATIYAAKAVDSTQATADAVRAARRARAAAWAYFAADANATAAYDKARAEEKEKNDE